MTIIYTAIACCILSTVSTIQVRSLINKTITVTGQNIEVEGHGRLDINDRTDIELLLSIVYDLCQHYQSCSRNMIIPTELQKYLSCCPPCSCFDDCFIVGDCCRDYIGDTTSSDDDMIVNENGETCSVVNSIDSTDTTQAYLLVNSCLSQPHRENNDDANKCLLARTLTEMTPVYSEQTGLTYDNVYCARCNNQNGSLSPWIVNVICNNYAPLHIEDMGLVLPEQCHYRWEPNGPHFTECYTKSNQKECDTKAKYPTICNNVKEGYRYVKVIETNTCSGCGRLPLEHLCFRITAITDKSYQALLNLNLFSDSDLDNPFKSKLNSMAESMCPERETFIETEERCMRTTCSPNQVTVYTPTSRCVEVVPTVVGLCLEYRVLATIQSTSTSSLLQNIAVTEVVRSIFPNKEMFSFLDKDTVNVTQTSDSVSYHVRVVGKLKRLSNVRSLFEKFVQNILIHATYESGIRIEHDNTGVAFIPQPLADIGFLSFDKNVNMLACGKTVAMSIVQFCEMVMLSPKDYSVYENIIILPDGREFRPHEYVFRESLDTDTHVQICLETFTARQVSKTNNQQSGSPTQSLQSKWLNSIVSGCLLLLLHQCTCM